MCGPYIHGITVIGAEETEDFFEFTRYNTHRELKDTYAKEIERLQPVKILFWGVQPWDGKVVAQARTCTDEELEPHKKRISLHFLAQFPDVESLIPWIDTHFGENGDADEWREHLWKLLDDKVVPANVKQTQVKWEQAYVEGNQAYAKWKQAHAKWAQADAEWGRADKSWHIKMFRAHPNAYWRGKTGAARKCRVAMVTEG